MNSEEQLVSRIAQAIPSHASAASGKTGQRSLRLGIGDDSAVVAPTGKTDWVISCDAFLEGVHFLPNRHSADSVGYKALVRATSDLAAMGATPRLFLLTLAIPDAGPALGSTGSCREWAGPPGNWEPPLPGATPRNFRRFRSILLPRGNCSRMRRDSLRGYPRRSYICKRQAGTRSTRPGTHQKWLGQEKIVSKAITATSLSRDPDQAGFVACAKANCFRHDGYIGRSFDGSTQTVQSERGWSTDFCRGYPLRRDSAENSEASSAQELRPAPDGAAGGRRL